MGDRQRIHRERLAIGATYGTVVYVTILVLLEEDRTDPKDAVAILVGTALVFWLAHVYAHLVPRIAATGRLRTGSFLGLLDSTAGLRAAIAAGILSLAAFGVREARAAGLGWGRSLGVATVLLAAGVGLVWLEVSLH